MDPTKDITRKMMKDTKKSLVMLKSTQTLKSTPRKVEQITTHSILQSIKFVMSINHSIVQKTVLNKFNFFFTEFCWFYFFANWDLAIRGNWPIRFDFLFLSQTLPLSSITNDVFIYKQKTSAKLFPPHVSNVQFYGPLNET